MWAGWLRMGKGLLQAEEVTACVRWLQMPVYLDSFVFGVHCVTCTCIMSFEAHVWVSMCLRGPGKVRFPLACAHDEDSRGPGLEL